MKLSLFPIDFFTLLHICRNCAEQAKAMYANNLELISTDCLCLADFYLHIRYRPEVWQAKNPRKPHTLRVPVSVAVAAHRYIRSRTIDPYTQMLLITLDQSLTNFQYPTP